MLLAALGAAFIIFIAGEIWWFFLKTPGTPPEATTTQNDILPPPQELSPLLPPEELLEPANELASLTAILSYDRTEIIAAEDNMAPAIDAAVESFDGDSVNSDELVRLTIKTIALDGPDTSELATLDDVIKGLGLKMPQNVRQSLSDDFDLFIFGAGYP